MGLWLRVLAGGLAVVVLAGCTDGGSGPGSPPSSSAAGKQWEMPDLVGMSLQAAQDRLQKLTGDPLFLSLSHDATGRGRQQVLDSNWKVCSQNLAPGTRFGLKTTIDFAAVKDSESCP